MSRILKIGIVGLLVVGALTAVMAGSVLAQEPTPTPKGWPGWGHGFGPMGHGGWAAFDAVAEALGLTPEQFFAELHAGKTLADLAEEKGVDLQSVYETLAATRQAAMRQAIEQAVEDGQMSREQADWMLQGLEQGWMPGHGFGGHGRGRGCGPGGLLQPEGKDQPQGSGFLGRFFAPGRPI